MNKVVLKCTAVSKTFADGDQLFTVLQAIDLSIEAKAMVAIMGRSGSGKTTLLQLLGGLDRPTTGSVELGGYNWNNMSGSAQAALRNQQLGFIYQQPHLLPEFTAIENVSMPLLIRKVPTVVAKNLASELLAEVGLQHRLNFMPYKLSGGERQRVAIARALINKPVCILADEPTGNLDRENAAIIMQLLHKIQQSYQTAIIMVTHDLNLAKQFNKTYTLQNGILN